MQEVRAPAQHTSGPQRHRVDAATLSDIYRLCPEVSNAPQCHPGSARGPPALPQTYSTPPHQAWLKKHD